MITLIDRFIYDNVDEESTTVYFLTPSEIESLKTNEILKIRFSQGPKKGHLSVCSNYTANNTHTVEIIDIYSYENKEVEETTNTAMYFVDFF